MLNILKEQQKHILDKLKLHHLINSLQANARINIQTD